MPAAPHVSRHPIRFGDVDAAGIVYYPRLVHLLHVAMEEFFADRVGIPYAALVAEQQIGFPTVHLECEFTKPIRHGETIAVTTTIAELGRSSVVFVNAVWVTDAADQRASARTKRVCVDLTTLRSVPLPEQIRQALTREAK